MKTNFACLSFLLVLGAISCTPAVPLDDHPGEFIKPTIAVMKFENRAPFPLKWDLGTGTQDVLVHRLVSVGRYHVIERPEIDSVLRELKFENSGMTRDQEKAALGQLKNVQYLIKGVITDFTHVASEHGFLSIGPFGGGAGASQAVMAIVIYVVDVQSGEIICSQAIQETVPAVNLDVAGTYKNVAFGGSVFYRTPLGEATDHVIDRAVKRITQVIGSRRWEPRVARVSDDGRVILNGGHDRDLTIGSEFDVLEPGTPILDPDTGDVIGRDSVLAIGRLRLTDVEDRYSVGQLTNGNPATMKTGQPCRRVLTDSAIH
ncbi:MAG TPA: CsgG/HfaB family protein [Humisphaera sp.]|nr:CsgG/HfaB family protein [Humisphaera sp.]